MAKVQMTQAANRIRAARIYERLAAAYPGANCTLDYANALELLVATILAAQCTDERVNIVTRDLFQKYRKPEDYVQASDGELEGDIRSCGFYNQKAKTIKGACKALIEKYGGQVPGTLEQLVRLDGVGRKTANVVLGQCFQTPGVIVDTHCRRVSQRLGFTKHDDPKKIEQELMKIWPRETWTQYSHFLVHHGRQVCKARGPACSRCVVYDLCPFPHTAQGKKTAN
jgi:endonuclease III